MSASNYILFTVPGKPAAQGSKIPGKTKSGRVFMRDADKMLTSFRYAVAHAALDAMRKANWLHAHSFGQQYLVSVTVFVRRPASHFTGKGMLRNTKQTQLLPTAGKDSDKILRAVFDALQGVVYENDRQVVPTAINKEWADVEATAITVYRLPPGASGKWRYEIDGGGGLV